MDSLAQKVEEINEVVDEASENYRKKGTRNIFCKRILHTANSLLLFFFQGV